ncbi:hypothetical protein A3Q56_08420, partial [Intoshia linei]
MKIIKTNHHTSMSITPSHYISTNESKMLNIDAHYILTQLDEIRNKLKKKNIIDLNRKKLLEKEIQEINTNFKDFIKNYINTEIKIRTKKIYEEFKNKLRQQEKQLSINKSDNTRKADILKNHYEKNKELILQ